MKPKLPGFLIAGTHSSVGKSSLAIGLMRLLRRKGINIRPFKVGPDYIDPSHHARACDYPSYNLDTWMCSPKYIQRLCNDVLGNDGVAVVEGVMGLFDGAYSKRNTASSAETASILNLPIVLVVDGKAMARSVAALVKGFTEFDASLKFLGVIANRVNSPGHAKILKDAIEHYTSIKFLGYLPDNPELRISDRHLGLFQGHEQSDRLYDLWADHIHKFIDINYLVKMSCKNRKSIQPSKTNLPNRWGIKRARPFTVAVAIDEAFQFVYHDTLDMFRQAGGVIKTFSPVNDRSLPENIDWIYLPGGYPELYARKLSSNKSMISQIHQFGDSGKPIVAECGGLMYLGNSIIDETGKRHKMANLFKFSTTMVPKRMTLGYRHLQYSPQSGKSIRIKGHEFHFSSLINNHETPQMSHNIATKIEDGYRHNNCFALYSHIYWAGSPGWFQFIINKLNTQPL